MSSNILSLSQGYSQSTLHQTVFTWAIDHFSYRYQKMKSPVFNDGQKMKVSLSLNSIEEEIEDGYLCLNIYPQFAVGKGKYDIYAKFKVSLIDSRGGKKLLYDNLHEADDEIILSELISRADLLKPSNGYLPGDTLTLYCEFGFVEYKTKNFLIPEIGASKVDTSQKALEDYGSLLKNGTFADVKLLVGGKTIPAHKSVLSVRSPVFAAMFTHDTKEKQEGQVVIPDVDLEAFETLLEFLYGCAMPALKSTKSAQELLIVADKYNVEPLKSVCEEYLISQITIEAAPNLLLLANSVNADKLKKRAIEFMRGRGNELFDALQNDPEQLVNLFQVLAVKNQEKEQSK